MKSVGGFARAVFHPRPSPRTRDPAPLIGTYVPFYGAGP